MSRLTTFQNKAKLGADVPDLELPAIDAGEHLVDYLFAVGPAAAGEALTFTEIRHWSNLTGTVLTAWEAETLRRLSSAYLSELDAAKDPKRPSPTRAAQLKEG